MLWYRRIKPWLFYIYTEREAHTHAWLYLHASFLSDRGFIGVYPVEKEGSDFLEALIFFAKGVGAPELGIELLFLRSLSFGTWRKGIPVPGNEENPGNSSKEGNFEPKDSIIVLKSVRRITHNVPLRSGSFVSLPGCLFRPDYRDSTGFPSFSSCPSTELGFC